ncbi:DUF7507 domain-containing protein [Demequina oxidasica]|uniref:DUF7507 domain-containing protein n=1 Tax=Demequina oxidasica TaxID=676199 RepID=UPI00078243FF|nr:hypothetical protein [Demequina oxidasica]
MNIERSFARRGAAAVAGLGVLAMVSIGVTAPAQAASDNDIDVTWSGATLDNDVNGNEKPDAGDTVKLVYSLNSLSARVADGVTHQRSSYGGFVLDRSLRLVFPMGLVTIYEVRAQDLDPLGGGPHLTDGVLEYLIDGGPTATLALDPALLAYTAPAPLTVTAAAELDEQGPTTDGNLVEGDRVRYSATIENVSAVDIVVPSVSGFEAGSLPMTLAAGATATLDSPWHEVTLVDMQAGAVSLAGAAVQWSASASGLATATGSVPVATPSVPTEAIDTSFTSDVKVVVHDSTRTVERVPGDVVEGDLVDYTFQLANDGNVAFRDLRFIEHIGATHTLSVNAVLPAGEAIPTAELLLSYISTDSPAAIFSPHTVTAADLTRGYVDLNFSVIAGPSSSWISQHTSTSQRSISKRVLLREFVADLDLSVDAVLQDSNGDGVGQAGEDVELTWTATLPADADQPVTISGVTEGGQVASLGAVFDGVNLVPGGSSTHVDTVTLDAAWIPSGALDYTATLSYVGDVDSAANSVVASATAIALGDYVAPAVSIDVAQRLSDLNDDGQASIGETVTFDVTVTNDGGYPLTGVVLGDAGGAVLDPAVVAVDSIAPGASAAWQETHQVTAADFTAGSFSYAPTVDADGMSTLTETSTVAPVTFAAYETDLAGTPAGGVTVCSTAGDPVTHAVQGDSVDVTVGDCDSGPLEAGSRVVAFSTPLVLGVDTGSVTVPATLAVGAHRIAVYGPNGAMVGWTALAVTAPTVPEEEPGADPVVDSDVDPAAVQTDPQSGGLSATGADGVKPMLWAAGLLMLLGAGAVVASRRRFLG